MKKIYSENGIAVLVDDGDYDWLNKYLWIVTANKRYPQAQISRRNILFSAEIYKGLIMSRLIMEIGYGDKRQVDHINHNRLDNRRCNLRICTATQNQGNRLPTKGKTSKYKGVSWNTKSQKWQSTIKKEGKTRHLGYFNSERTAALAYNIAAKKYFGKFSLLNKI